MMKQMANVPGMGRKVKKGKKGKARAAARTGRRRRPPTAAARSSSRA